MNIISRLERGSSFIKAMWSQIQKDPFPNILLICGSGFKSIVEEMEISCRIDLAKIPYAPTPSIAGHGAQLVIGKLKNNFVCVLTGRVHLYEGFSAHDVVHMVRVLNQCGVNKLLVTNAAGSLQLDYKPGSFILIQDQINLTGKNSLIGDGYFHPTVFVDMTQAYDQELLNSLKSSLKLNTGTYVGVMGSAYETPAETRAFGMLGGHMVGMSTVHEVIAARQLNMTIAGISFISNYAGGLGKGDSLNHEEVLDQAKQKNKEMISILQQSIEIMSKHK